MNQATIRKATLVDVPIIRDIVHVAYAHYVVRMGRQPVPIGADYEEVVADGTMWVLTTDQRVAA